MTLHIIHSNKVEHLHDELCYLLQKSPLANPFDVETIVCPSKAMARWINIRFTQKMGIAAHYDYPMPSSWVWQLADLCLPDVPSQDPLQRDLMAWQIFHALSQNDDGDSFDPINHYLKDDGDSTKQWSLANKIASVFERYQHFRPDLIQQWNAGQGEANDWQAKLWQGLTHSLNTDRVQLLIELGKQLSKKTALDSLPKRVTFFSVTALPSLLFKNIQALAKHCEVYFFVLSPSVHYWSDFVSLKQLAKQRLKSPELNYYYTTGHDLLASWGRQGQVFQDMLLHEIDDSITEHYDVYDDQFSPRLLNQLQQSFFELNDGIINIEGDDSIIINQCHSALRECEVLHDQCLNLLQNTEITPEDILVIVPNMQQYAVSIEAVFKKSADQIKVKPFIPWNLSDSSLQAEDPLIRTFLNTLLLPNSRFSVSDILAYLDCPELLQQFNLQQTDCAIIREYIQKAHIHWGLDAAHKHHLKVPETIQNTWHQAQQAFYSAYSVDEVLPFEGVAPLAGFSSSRAAVIAQFMLLLDCLNHWREKLSYARSTTQWQGDLNVLIDVLFGDSEDSRLQRLRDAIDELVVQSHQPKVTQQPKIQRSLVQKWLSDYFDDTQNNQRFFTGGITFCGMRPMRSVPFKVIVMLGMNEHEFPRHNTPIEFDLMAAQWRPGDLLISDEDRYLFLEALLCARHTLIISYCAKSIKDNAAKEPSHLVSELCDYLDAHFMLGATNDSNKNVLTTQRLSSKITTQYAMHAFSAENYGEAYQSYNRYWADIAQQLLLTHKSDHHMSASDEAKQENINEPDINLNQLISCLKDPLAFYFKSQLKISLYDENENDDDEPFDLDALQKWSLKNRLINAELDHEEQASVTAQIQNLLPHGAHAKAYIESIEEDIDAQFDGLALYLEQTPQSKAINLTLDNGHQLNGKINYYYDGLGLLTLTPSNFGAKPLMSCWINHCALAASGHLKPSEISLLRFKDKHISFPFLTIDQALQYLNEAIDMMQNAKQTPLALLPKCSFVYQWQCIINDAEKAHKEALLKWHGNRQNEASLGEKETTINQLMFQDYYNDPSALLSSDAFISAAKSLYATPLTQCEIEDKA